MEEAEAVQQMLCTLTLDGRYVLPGVSERSGGGKDLAGLDYGGELIGGMIEAMRRRNDQVDIEP